MSFIKRHLKSRIRFNAAAMHYYNDDFSKTRPSDEDDHSEIHESFIILRSDTGAQLRNVGSVLVDKIISENRYGNLGGTLVDVIRSYSQQLEAAPQVTGDASLLPINAPGSESNDVSIWWLVGLCSILPNFPLGTILCFLSFWYFQRQSSRNVEGYELKKSERDTTAF